MSLTVAAANGGATSGTAQLDGKIDGTATGDSGGAFDAGGDITLTSDADLAASANARGGYIDSGSLPPTASDIRIAAAGNVALTDSVAAGGLNVDAGRRSEEHTSELQSLMRISYAVFCLKKTNLLAHGQA